MIHRSPPNQPSGDDADRHRHADRSELRPDEALSWTDVDLFVDMDQSEDQRALRLAADRQIVEVLAREGFEGERFDELFKKLTKRLVGYAWPILMQWTDSGQIFRECEKYRRPVSRPKAWSGWTSEDQDQVVKDTCIEAVEFFREYGLRKGKWDAHRGACLTTYFVGACVCCFAKVFDRWWKEQQVADSMRFVTRESDDTESDPLDRLPDPRPGPDMIAVTRDAVRRVMRQVPDPQLHYVLWEHAKGSTQAEAARKAGLTPKAAERRLARYRARPLDPPADPADPR